MTVAVEHELEFGGTPWYEWPQYQQGPSELTVLSVGNHTIDFYNMMHAPEGQRPSGSIGNVSNQYGSVLAQFKNRYPVALNNVEVILVTDQLDEIDGETGRTTPEQGLIELPPSVLSLGKPKTGELPIAPYVATLIHELGKFVLPELTPIWVERAVAEERPTPQREELDEDILRTIVAFEYAQHVIEAESEWKLQTMVDFTVKSRTEAGGGLKYPTRFSRREVPANRIAWPPRVT